MSAHAVCLCPPCIIPRQAAKACRPCVTALHVPALGQQPEALCRLGQLHDFEVPLVHRGVLGRLGPRLSLVDKGHGDRLPRHLWNLARQGTDRAAVLLARCRDVGHQTPSMDHGFQHASLQVVNACCSLLPMGLLLQSQAAQASKKEILIRSR